MIFSIPVDIDFTFSSGPLPFNVTFHPVDNRRAIDLYITDDQSAEGDEFIDLQLINPVGNITIGQQMAQIKIQDNDGRLLLIVVKEVQDVLLCFPSPVVTVGFSSSMYTVVESTGSVEVCVQAENGTVSLSSGGYVTFSISVTPSTAGKTYHNISHFWLGVWSMAGLLGQPLEYFFYLVISGKQLRLGNV